MRSRASVPIAENMSAYLAIFSEAFLVEAGDIFPWLQKYSIYVKPPSTCCQEERFRSSLSMDSLWRMLVSETVGSHSRVSRRTKPFFRILGDSEAVSWRQVPFTRRVILVKLPLTIWHPPLHLPSVDSFSA